LSDYPAVNDLIYTKGVEFSITSLRSNEKSAELIRLLTGNKSVSIAPEAGTERMRTVINKQVTEEDILNTSAWILDAGIKNLRLYFMIGLPTERLDDIEGIIELVMKVRGRSRQGIITLSISTFVPKPFTAFQWHPMEQAEDLKKKLKLIKDGLKNKKGVRVLHDVPKYALLQGLFARGDRTILRLVEAMVRTNDWMKASNEVGLDRDFSLMRQRSYEEKLPWDFIDAGISKQRLWDEYISALSQI
jgi:radical SAM superfamily enzyme YgiQ (UPF0313 family)